MESFDQILRRKIYPCCDTSVAFRRAAGTISETSENDDEGNEVKERHCYSVEQFLKMFS